MYDAISDGLNMEPTNRLTLARRPGYTVLDSQFMPSGMPKYFYSFKPSNFPGQIYNLIDSDTFVWCFQPGNGILNTWNTVVAKITSPLTTFAQVGAYCYMAQEVFAQKWDGLSGPQQTTNWGIDMYNSIFTQGPKTLENSSQLGTGTPWVGEPGQGAAVTVPAPPAGQRNTSQWLKMYQYGFNFQPPPGFPYPGSYVVSGIAVDSPITSDLGEGRSINMRLLRNQAFYGTYRTATMPPVGGLVLGGPSDSWDGAWTTNDINQVGFGVAIQAVNSSSSAATFNLLNPLRITVYINSAPVIFPLPGATSRQPSQIGYNYKYCYGNSHSGHLSSPTPPSFYGQPTTNPDGLINPGNEAVQVELVPSQDPQVDCIHVFRTTDGGGYPFFELPNSPVPNVYPGGPIYLNDSADDNTLQIANICPDPLFNNPPPGGAVDPVFFAGRLWLHRGNQLWFASGPDITMGNENEAWYPAYVFSVPGQIVRKFATPNGLFLVCLDEILIVRGISTASFVVNDFAKDTGMRTWTAGDTDGTNAYIYTSDRQFLLVNPNGLSSISGNVADTISVVDPTKAYVSLFRYTALQNWIFLADGSTTIYGYNQDVGAWATKQVPVNGVGAIGTIESTPGEYQFWRARPVEQSHISFRDSTIFADEGLTYPCSATFGPIPVADFLTLSQLRDIVLAHAATTSTITLSVLANEIFPVAGQQYQILQISSTEPPELSATPSLSYSANRYTWKSAPLPELVNLCFLRLDFSADANPDELFTWTLGGSQTTGGSSLGAPGQLPQLQGR